MSEHQNTQQPLGAYSQKLIELMQQDSHVLPQVQKESLLLAILNDLHLHHQQHCLAYQNIINANQQQSVASELEALPYIAVRLFKQLELYSIDQPEIFKVLQSSGTTSQTAAKVYLDKATSARQSKALVNILQATIGKQRLPMLIIDAASTVKNPKFSARAAGIQGLAFFGRDHCYALDDNMQPDWPAIAAFTAKYRNQPVLIFGFTFMLWAYFIEALKQQNKQLKLEQAIVLHSGGWKKLEDQKVDNDTLKAHIKQTIGATKVHNFYGMAEQVGTIFVECYHGHLHAPLLADVIVRNPYDLSPCKISEQGIIQVLSALPTSYPGFSLLTEDMGRITAIDTCPCGQLGKTIAIDGRLPKTEVRGCSDTQTGVAHG
ncbi:acyl-protein synthetase [Paraglaciecola sp.]|uniref:LuxE/PaaK family acyltransferase n=1 Tax=Paraglaciecola sp. TaxID=1920173 RepID=UPI00273E5836|nr:acyl-protein synthetase [Paraglaciecola sp.]MDP5029283.1 acyl-protein synthetase [Paraglaciecola sp.]